MVLVRVVGLEMVAAGVAVLFTILGVFLALGTILDNWSTTEVIPDVIWSNTACFQGATVVSSLWHFLKKDKKNRISNMHVIWLFLQKSKLIKSQEILEW